MKSYRDTFKLGNPDSQVKGIATTVMVTFDVLKRAHEAGLNMIEHTVPTKTEYVLKNDMIVWRIHDQMHPCTQTSRWWVHCGR